MDDINAGRAPNTGHFCAECYQPLAAERRECPYCGTDTSERAPVSAIPLEILDAHRKRRGREGTVVRTVAWAGLTLSPAVGAILMSASTIVVALNAQLLRRVDLSPEPV